MDFIHGKFLIVLVVSLHWLYTPVTSPTPNTPEPTPLFWYGMTPHTPLRTIFIPTPNGKADLIPHAPQRFFFKKPHPTHTHFILYVINPTHISNTLFYETFEYPGSPSEVS